MRDFKIYELSGGALICDVQSTLLDEIETRITVPLIPIDYLRPMPKYNVVVDIKGEEYVFLTQSMTSLPRGLLKNPIGDLSEHYDDLSNAIDFLFHGF